MWSVDSDLIDNYRTSNSSSIRIEVDDTDRREKHVGASTLRSSGL